MVEFGVPRDQGQIHGTPRAPAMEKVFLSSSLAQPGGDVAVKDEPGWFWCLPRFRSLNDEGKAHTSISCFFTPNQTLALSWKGPCGVAQGALELEAAGKRLNAGAENCRETESGEKPHPALCPRTSKPLLAALEFSTLKDPCFLPLGTWGSNWSGSSLPCLPV